MKIAYNPLGSAAYIPAADNKDLIFDLVTRTIYAKGVPFDGTKYNTFKKHTSPDNTGGSEGLVPIPSYSALNNRLLREDGLWVLIAEVSAPDDTLSLESTNSVENKVITKKFNDIIALLLLKAEHVYKNIVINGVLLLAQGANDTLTIIQGDGITLTPNSDNKSITISTKALGLLGIDISYSEGLLIAKVTDTYYARWNEVFNWYQSVTEEDTDLYINKWLEIVDFLNNVQLGTNILDEFVTRKTDQTIIGTKTFSLQIISTVAEGTAPFVVDSSTRVLKLNADMVDNYHIRKWFNNASDIDNSAVLWLANGECSDIQSMAYSALINVVGGTGRRWQIWNSRNNHQLYWRPELPDMSGYALEHILLDNLNYKGFIELMYWANVPISATSSTTTSPTFANATMSGILTFTTAGNTAKIKFLNGEIIDGYGNIKLGTSSKSWNIFLKDGTKALAVYDSGNVGIGTIDSAAAKLHIIGNTLLSLGANGDLYYRVQGLTHNVWFGLGSGGINRGIWDPDNSNWMLYRDNTTNVLIPLGNVGIGTTSPRYILHVANTIYATSTNEALIINRTGTHASKPCISYYNAGTKLGSIGVKDYNTPFFFNNNNSTIYTIWHAGNDGSGSGLDADLLDGVHASGLLTALSSSSSTNLSITVGGTTKSITNTYATNITLISCYKGTTNNDLWSTIKTGNSTYLGTANIYEVYKDGGPTTYGEVLDIVSAHTNRWLALLWFGSGKAGHLYYRNKDYNDATWGSWRTILDTGNYSSYLGYIGTTAVLKSSAAQALTGITNATLSGKLIFTTAGEAASISFLNGERIDGYGNVLLGTNSASWNVFNSSRSSLITVLKSGNVGIGTTSPSYKLHVTGSGYFSGNITVGGNQYVADSTYGINMLNSDIALINSLYFADLAGSSTEGIHFYRSTTTWDSLTAKNGILYFSGNRAISDTTLTPVFSALANSGNNISITIGGKNRTLTPAYATKAGNADTVDGIHASGFILTNSLMIHGAYAVIPTYNGETGWHRIATIDGGTGYGSWILYLCGSWRWASNTTAILHINTRHTTAKITQVSGIVGFVTDVRLVPISANNYYVDVYINYSGANKPGTVYCYFLGNGAITTRTTAEKITASVSTAASITLVTGTRTNDDSYAAHFYENSDVMLKTNIKSITDSDNMPILKSFDWKSDGSRGYGLIAQELEAMGYPELVSGELDGTKTVNYSAALSLIVGKLQVKIRELEKEIEILKNKN